MRKRKLGEEARNVVGEGGGGSGQYGGLKGYKQHG